jgi:hypothetical protein
MRAASARATAAVGARPHLHCTMLHGACGCTTITLAGDVRLMTGACGPHMALGGRVHREGWPGADAWAMQIRARTLPATWPAARCRRGLRLHGRGQEQTCCFQKVKRAADAHTLGQYRVAVAFQNSLRIPVLLGVQGALPRCGYGSPSGNSSVWLPKGQQGHPAPTNGTAPFCICIWRCWSSWFVTHMHMSPQHSMLHASPWHPRGPTHYVLGSCARRLGLCQG